MSDAEAGGTDRNALYTKIAWRLLPLLIICYVANLVDRTNVAIAQLELRSDLQFSSAVYGLGVGLFFLGFIIFEVPSNVLLSRIGARKTLLRIMVLWGAISASTMFVTTPWQFYLVRIALGAAEAGFFPGILLYMTYWFPSRRRAQMVALFTTAAPLSSMLGSPLSGWIMQAFDGRAGMHGWQWMFLLEGLPSIGLGVAAYLLLSDGPQTARWLTPAEKAAVARDLAADSAGKVRHDTRALLTLLRDPRLYVLGLAAFGAYTLANAISFWSPLIINASGVKNILNIALLTAIPPVFGILAMLVVSRSSDRRGERRWHAAASQYAAAAAFLVLAATVNSPWLTVTMLAVATAGHYGGSSVLWGIPSIYLPDELVPMGLAMVTAMGSVAAMIAPSVLGVILDRTGSLALGLQISAGVVACTASILILGMPRRLLWEAPSHG